MKRLIAALLSIISLQSTLAQGNPSEQTDGRMPEVERTRFCERVRDQALQAFYNRDRGRPMKLFEEDGSDGARITNHIIRRIYEEPQISSPRRAETFGRATCNEMMGASTRQ